MAPLLSHRLRLRLPQSDSKRCFIYDAKAMLASLKKYFARQNKSHIRTKNVILFFTFGGILAYKLFHKSVQKILISQFKQVQQNEALQTFFVKVDRRDWKSSSEKS